MSPLFSFSMIVHFSTKMYICYKVKDLWKAGWKMTKSMIKENGTPKRNSERSLESEQFTNETEDLLKIIKYLKESNLLPVITDFLTKRTSSEMSQLDTIKKGVRKGIESAMSTLDSGKELSSFQVMKLLKDQDINRAVLFLMGFLKGMGKNI